MKKLRKPKLSTARTTKLNVRSVKFLTLSMMVIALGLFGGMGYIWYTKIFTDGDRIFYDMVSSSMETDSVTRHISQNEASRSESQTYLMSFTPQTVIKSTSTVEQIGQDRAKSSVTTETIGLKDVDYVRYTDINIPASDDKTDYSKVLNSWAKREANKESGQAAQFLNEAVFTFVPFGNFSTENRATLMDLMKQKKVYVLNNGKITYEDGRPIYTVDVSIKPQGLVEVLKKYADLTGLGNQEMLDPSQYDDSNSFVVKMKVDMLSRHLKQLDYPGETRSESYSGYGLNSVTALPTQTISVEELQSKLQ